MAKRKRRRESKQQTVTNTNGERPTDALPSNCQNTDRNRKTLKRQTPNNAPEKVNAPDYKLLTKLNHNTI